MVKPDYKNNELETTVVARPFDTALAELTNDNYQLISLAQNAQLRLEAGARHEISQYGNYVEQGAVHHEGEKGIVLAKSYLLVDEKLICLAVEANRKGKYFSTESKDLYDLLRKQVDDDSSKPPCERRAMFIPSNYGRFFLSPTQNPELFEMLLGERRKEYLRFVSREALPFHPTHPQMFSHYLGTILTQMHFSNGGIIGESSSREHTSLSSCSKHHGFRGIRPISR